MIRDLDNSALLSIVVLTWNNFADTAECLHSLRKLNYLRYNVVLVDNGSTDGSIERLQSVFQEVKIIKNGENLGYAGGNNIGIEYALSKGVDYVLLLNNDTIVDVNLATELVQASHETKNLGIFGCVNYYYDDRKKVQFSGGIFNWKTGDIIDTTRHKIDKGQFQLLKEVDTVAGSCLFFPTTVIKTVGLLDNRYFLTFEESDLCCRVKKAGYKVYTYMGAGIWHKVSVSGQAQKEGLNILKYYAVRNRFLFLTKNSPKRYLPVSLTYHIARTVVHISKELRKGNMAQAKLLLFGLIDGILCRFGKGYITE
jgi:GT2 family glycosyltransferase